MLSGAKKVKGVMITVRKLATEKNRALVPFIRTSVQYSLVSLQRGNQHHGEHQNIRKKNEVSVISRKETLILEISEFISTTQLPIWSGTDGDQSRQKGRHDKADQQLKPRMSVAALPSDSHAGRPVERNLPASSRCY